MEKRTKILALVGKGGVGKTTICSAFVRILSEKYPEARILAIDADPAVGLSTALGVTPGVTLDDLRREIIEKAAAGAGKEAIELLGEVRFRIFDALTETECFSFLAIGRPEGAGCYCAVNAYLKEVIEMISRDFDFVVIDGEAGIEQVNRRVMERVTHLFFVTDGSKKGVQVINSIHHVADELVAYDKCGVIVNRVDDPEVIRAMTGGNPAGEAFWPGMDQAGKSPASGAKLAGMEILSMIPGDPEHARNDVLGKSIFELSADAPVCRGAREALERMGL
ncbi:MAG: AAA family ATPase [Lachnospiraceae bacterium]|nr:AAA family ATPase [Lachnospiraceae bacterium]